MSSPHSAAALRSKLGHPVIDADGHWLEFGSVVEERMSQIGGAPAADGFAYYTSQVVKDSLALSREQRRARRLPHPVWWGVPTRNTRDRATAMLPGMLYDRLDELGIDFSVLYPSAGLGLTRIPDREARLAACHAFNVISAETFARHADRMTPVAVIPMNHPDEALAELDHAIVELGLKVAMFGSLIVRPVPAYANAPGAEHSTWRDVLGLDSEFDYDPVWARCAELGVSPTFHTGARDLSPRRSPTNFVYNHLGHFAAAGEAVCKALVLGGVTQRFPTLKFAFLEGGVSWACQLYADLIEHWETRSLGALDALDPDQLDHELMLELAQRYAGPEVVEALRKPGAVLDNSTPAQRFEPFDDFAACYIERAEDFRERFARPFYFGCEADDRMSRWAYDRRSNPLGVRLNTLFGSDIGHFDVREMAGVLPEAHELVDDGLISPADFRRFVFENPVRFWGEANPDFFRGTAVESEARAQLASV